MIDAPSPEETVVAIERPRIAVVGCGDVAHRRYLPGLAALGDRIELVATGDRSAEAAQRAVVGVAGWAPAARPFTDLEELLRETRPDAIVTLTPAPQHAAVSQIALEGGVHVYSEKPLASNLAEADRLIATAHDGGLLLLCAPAEAVTRRTAWLKAIVESGRLGRLTLAVAHHADTGPATWREYTGDPTVFYGPGVGPVFDHGIYRLHLLIALMGRVRRVQAMGSVSAPERMVRAGPLAGRSIPVTAPDHVLIQLEFESGALGQLLASFGAAGTQAPWLELHFEHGTVSFPGKSWDKDAPASLFLDDDGPLGLEGWIHGLRPPPPGEELGLIEAGLAHFVGCLRGEERPVLTAEAARHVLDIVLKAYRSIEDGRSHETETRP